MKIHKIISEVKWIDLICDGMINANINLSGLRNNVVSVQERLFPPKLFTVKS